MDSNYGRSSCHHVVLFPYMSKGHTIPILHLARLLLHRTGMQVTVFTTPANRPFVAHYLTGTASSIIALPFPENIPGIPPGVESTDKLPSLTSLLVPFTRATKLMQPAFEQALESLPPVSFMVSDGFLWWTLDSATRFGFARLAFYGTNSYAHCVMKYFFENHQLLTSDSEFPDFPTWIKIPREEVEELFSIQKNQLLLELIIDQEISTKNSYGIIVNSFYGLEPTFADSFNINGDPEHKSWCIGPLCLAEQPNSFPSKKPNGTMQWLDQKLEQGQRVLYVAFGSQADISREQLKEIATGLEKSEMNFLWVIRDKEAEVGEGFEERVKERGLVVREWVDQRQILTHQSVEGFLSHCGWNSVLESICAGVPVLAWPMSAEQPLNARIVEEETKVGLRVKTADGKMRGFVKWESLEKMVRELMEGVMGKKVREKVKQVAEMAKMAMEEDSGSSWRNLEALIDEITVKVCQN